MSFIYALSDIHGNLDALNKALEKIDLKEEDKIIFCGDYVDRGVQSFDVLMSIMELESRWPQQVVVLWGNHDEWFCDWLFKKYDDVDEYLLGAEGANTIRSFFDLITFKRLVKFVTSKNLNHSEENSQLSELFRRDILEKNQHLVAWLRRKDKACRYYETEKQIYVHAGVDEEAGDFWKWGTPEEMYTMKYPATLGSFSKQVIAGHIATEEIGGSKYLGEIYWDGKSHFYIDGNTTKTGIVPVLNYNCDEKTYSSNGVIIQ